ncbi:MAG: LamG domain-containing protein, partial [Nitrosospira sp.]|nr:LamG domain-containing protein [Nitrosospira sp.]
MKKLTVLFIVCALPGLLAVSGCSDSIPEKGLVAYYPFDGNAKNVIGEGSRSVSRNITFVDGVSGRAAKFGGYGNVGYIVVPHNPSLTFGGQRSISMWVRVDGSYGQTGANCTGNRANHATQVLLAKSGDRVGFRLAAGTNKNGRVSLRSNVSGPGMSNNAIAGASGGSEVNIGEWFHVVYTFDKSGSYIYVNGKLIAHDKRPANLTESNGEKMYFGIQSGKGSCLPFWFPFNGALDNLRIYNRSLN